ncbi:MAG: hypothetical protein U0M53_04000 [Oscillospiraceae bacterium]|nr:hypothetical protein [Oscillospiraceae bacterium]
MKDNSFWALFRETGEPLFWLLSREKRETEKDTKPEREKSGEGAARN